MSTVAPSDSQREDLLASPMILGVAVRPGARRSKPIDSCLKTWPKRWPAPDCTVC